MSSFTTFPSTIVITGSWSNRSYELSSTTSTSIQYELHDSNGLVGAAYGIQFVNPTNSTCTLDVEGSGDLGTPHTIGSTNGSSTQSVAAGDSVTLYETTGAVATITIPNFFGGGTNSEGVVTIDDAVGNLSNNASFSEMDVSISALSPGGSDYTYRLMKDNVLVDYRNNHVNGVVSNYTIDYSSVGQYGIWDLTVMQVSTLTVKHLRRLTLVDPTAPVQNKKVHSNFW